MRSRRCDKNTDIHLLRLKTLFRSPLRTRPLPSITCASNYSSTGASYPWKEKNKNRPPNTVPSPTLRSAMHSWLDTPTLTPSITGRYFIYSEIGAKFPGKVRPNLRRVGLHKKRSSLYDVSRECGEKFPLLKIVHRFMERNS